ncbi:MAG TPA: hypothetical protein VK555_02240, partial [Terriglobales bacterium]|nr:hypothetical protein [Terriglobales bacterium]
FAMLNQTRVHPGIARESKFQGPGINRGLDHANSISSVTFHFRCKLACVAGTFLDHEMEC